MAQLIVRNLETKIVQALKVRAAEHGRSAEAEHREILRKVLRPEPTTTIRDHLFAIPDVGCDEDFERQQDLGRTVEL
jgi:plasmid stability protein